MKWIVRKSVVTTRQTHSSDEIKISQLAKDKYRKDPRPFSSPLHSHFHHKCGLQLRRFSTYHSPLYIRAQYQGWFPPLLIFTTSDISCLFFRQENVLEFMVLNESHWYSSDSPSIAYSGSGSCIKMILAWQNLLNAVAVVTLATRGQSGFKSHPVTVVLIRANAWTELYKKTVWHLFLYCD